MYFTFILSKRYQKAKLSELIFSTKVFGNKKICFVIARKEFIEILNFFSPDKKMKQVSKMSKSFPKIITIKQIDIFWEKLREKMLMFRKLRLRIFLAKKW